CGVHVLADDGARWKLDPVEQARAACAGGAAVVQLRTKRAVDRAALAWAVEIRRCTEASGALFFVNDRFDLALAARADGVHVGQDDLPPARIPPHVREILRVGLSTHTLEQLRAARAQPVDYLAFGPVFGTRSKVSEYAERGLDALAEAVRSAGDWPLIAIGGIDAGNIGDVLRSGAAGVAVISCVAGADDPVAATRELATLWRRGAGGARC
ncbi:MAG TPA: thiamine phosphate synthase, partial [Myxococcota bacterium]